MSSAGRIALEVERKFCGLINSHLTAQSGTPAFKSLKYLGTHTFKDIYYDLDERLSAQGVWVRRRTMQGKSPMWQAKCRQSGSYINSIFEELNNTQAIAECVATITLKRTAAEKAFGLTTTAEMVTERKSWLADEQFTIVLDSMDFGHEIGEVELEKTVILPSQQGQGFDIEQWKSSITKEMDQQIEQFMRRYSWAFKAGTPKGKLTAFYEKRAAR